VSPVPLEEARARVLSRCPPLSPRAVPLGEALGCVTSVELTAEEDVPPFANTAMDGYALRAADTAGAPVGLRMAGTVAAGEAPTVEVGPGQAVRIMTGAPVPPGADAVVMVELTRPEEGPGGGETVVVEKPARPGYHIRRAGEDVAAGQVVFGPGTVLGPGHLGVLASLGYVRAPVYPRARVGVLSTGDELVEGPGPLRPGQVRDANRRTLLALLDESGCEPVDLGLAPDDETAIRAALEAGLEGCDALLTSGGVSVGDYDYVTAVLGAMGRVEEMKVAIKPAKPFTFGLVGGRPVFGLPGNPVSSMVSFELFARPALRQMMGHRHLDRPRVEAVADEALPRRPDGKVHFARVVAAYGPDGRFHVRSAGGQGSHLLRAMALANALAMLPDGDGAEAGSTVEVMLLQPW
jgi:molybdopterin molybdotransferase